MSERRNSLSPPERTETEDPGAHELYSSDSEDHFSDAHSGPEDTRSKSLSPIPKTRVERVDDQPSYGEVPGTEAYRLREGDAEPDEIAIIPDAESVNLEREVGLGSEIKQCSAQQPVPMTMVEETPDTDGSVTHPEIKRNHQADTPPDLVMKASEHKTKAGGAGSDGNDIPVSPSLTASSTVAPLRKMSSDASASTAFVTPTAAAPAVASSDESDGDGDEAGDGSNEDFDDFAEGGEDGVFGDFDDGFQQANDDSLPTPKTAFAFGSPTHPLSPSAQPQPAASSISFPIPDFNDLDASEIYGVSEPYLNALFPTFDETEPANISSSKSEHPIFFTPRSASLWTQLVAPPPLQPPDWIRSRIRRLFLVSLGVPVDLDEILPASKQKKLVLPSLHGEDSSRSRSVSRVRQNVDANISRSSQDSRTARSGAKSPMYKQRKGHPTGPKLDLVAAKQLCMTTDAALDGMTDEELNTHVKSLEGLDSTAVEVLEYWKKRTDEKIGDREAFEGVIENLVKHARKVRK